MVEILDSSLLLFRDLWQIFEICVEIKQKKFVSMDHLHRVKPFEI